MRWLRLNWPILVFIFAAGGVSAQQEWRLHQLEAKQGRAEQDSRTIIRLDERQTTMLTKQADTIKKLDMLIELQIRNAQPRNDL